jgi:hypothetical protein
LAVKFFGTIVTFDSGYSLWRHSDIIVMEEEQQETLLFQWERRKRNMGRNDVGGILPS